MDISSKLSKSLIIASVGLGVFASSSSYAGQDTGSILITATVDATCEINGYSDGIFFGHYDGFAGPVDNIDGTVNILCTNGVPYTVSLGAGTAGTDYLTNRLLDGPGSSTLQYQLFSDDFNTVWGTLADDAEIGATSEGTTQDHPISARLYGGQFDAVAGAYQDTITVTLDY